jgi:hypothetical protein
MINGNFQIMSAVELRRSGRQSRASRAEVASRMSLDLFGMRSFMLVYIRKMGDDMYSSYNQCPN